MFGLALLCCFLCRVRSVKRSKPRSLFGLIMLVLLYRAVSQGAEPRSPTYISLLGIIILVLLYGAVSQGVKPRSH